MVKKLLGDAVREERLRRNLSQNSLAEQAKISLRTVSDIENYIGNPQLETLYAFSDTSGGFPLWVQALPLPFLPVPALL